MRNFRFRPMLALCAIAATLALTAVEADARVGGSFGSRGSRTFSAPPPTATALKATAPINRTMTQPGAATRPRRPAPGPSGSSTFLAWDVRRDVWRTHRPSFLGAGLIGTGAVRRRLLERPRRLCIVPRAAAADRARGYRRPLGLGLAAAADISRRTPALAARLLRRCRLPASPPQPMLGRFGRRLGRGDGSVTATNAAAARLRHPRAASGEVQTGIWRRGISAKLRARLTPDRRCPISSPSDNGGECQPRRDSIRFPTSSFRRATSPKPWREGDT